MTKIFKNLIKKNKNQIKKYEIMFPLFDLFKEFNELKNLDYFISYDQLMSSVLFKTSLSFNSDIYLKYLSTYSLALEKKYQMIYKTFIISFGIDSRIGNKFLIPIVQNSKNDSIDFVIFTSSSNLNENYFYECLNNEINALLQKSKIIEILPSILIYYSKNSKTLKISIDKNQVSEIKK
ncbi:MSC_0623 family F1-like ATPase-associated protein [Mycoplasmopsis cricetuli]|uniref:MSC_0623 family F1-like ATPase-associated protein n=1 Tax=Mycoplasmopsis cricetuli TaxID=171283 RepID=UPI000470EBD8|nr:DUF2714 domain-containing protein [Mycoplasmopsis cricetuli]